MFHYGLADELIKLAAPSRVILRRGFKPARSIKRGWTPSELAHHEKIKAQLTPITKTARPIFGIVLSPKVLRRITRTPELYKEQKKLEQLYKVGSVKEVGRRLAEIIKHDPGKLKDIAKELASGPGGSVAKGLVYGAGGYGALKGLGRKDPKSRRREPFEGAVRGAAKGVAIGLPAALLLRYPALKRALGVG